MDLSDVLSGQEETQAPAPEQGGEQPAAVAATPVEATPAESSPKGDESAPPAQLTNEERGQLEALKAEREKRQAAEQRAQQLEGMIRAQAQPVQQPAPQPEPVKFYDDPEKAVQQMASGFQQAILNTRIDTSEMIARTKYPDFDEKAKVFVDLARANPPLAAQMMQSHDPASFAYNAAKNFLALKDVGDIDSFREKVRAEERAKIEQEMKRERDAQGKFKASIPPSLGETRGAAPASQTTFQAPSLESILK